MNDLKNKKIEEAVNIRDLVWNLLSQWKAVLIVALIMAVLTTGYKYMSDSKSYEEAKNARNGAEETKTLSADEQIEKILEGFSEEDKNTIEYMVQQKEWVDKQKDYINNSILMNVDPTKQRTIFLDYYIASEEGTNSIATSLLYGYSSYATSESIVNGIREAIGADVDNRYIAELISTPFNNNNNTYNIGAPAGFDDGDAVLEVKVVIPEDVDAAKVENVMTAAFSDYSAELSKSVGSHVIRLLRSEEAYIYNAEAVSNRNSAIANIYNIQNSYIKNMEMNLSDEQNGAIESIMAVKRAEKNLAGDEAMYAEASAEEPTAPGISKKYALAGFFLGIAVYACVYAIYVMFKGSITSAQQTETYTGSRLLGEIYTTREYKGIQKLLHSRIVDSIRYRGKLDPDAQSDKIVSAISALCKHTETDSVNVFIMPGEACISEAADKVTNKIRGAGIDVALTDVDETTDGNSMLNAKNAIIMANGESTAAGLSGLSDLLSEFDVPLLGNIYVDAI